LVFKKLFFTIRDIPAAFSLARSGAMSFGDALRSIGINPWTLGISAAITAISLFNTYLEKNKQKLKEAAQEASNQAEESANNVQSLLELKTQLEEGTTSSNELTSAFKEQLKAMGYTETQIDNLITKYGGLAGAMDEATREALEKAKTDAHTDVSVSSQSLKPDATHSLSVGLFTLKKGSE